jgi:hypothetical protein
MVRSIPPLPLRLWKKIRGERFSVTRMTEDLGPKKTVCLSSLLIAVHRRPRNRTFRIRPARSTTTIAARSGVRASSL